MIKNTKIQIFLSHFWIFGLFLIVYPLWLTNIFSCIFYSRSRLPRQSQATLKSIRCLWLTYFPAHVIFPLQLRNETHEFSPRNVLWELIFLHHFFEWRSLFEFDRQVVEASGFRLLVLLYHSSLFISLKTRTNPNKRWNMYLGGGDSPPPQMMCCGVVWGGFKFRGLEFRISLLLGMGGGNRPHLFRTYTKALRKSCTRRVLLWLLVCSAWSIIVVPILWAHGLDFQFF